MNKAMLLILGILAAFVISGCATEQGSGSAYDYENSYGNHVGHHH